MFNSFWRNTIYFSVALIALILANVLFSKYFIRIDVTAEKKFTLTKQTKTFLYQIPENLYAEIYLSGELPVGFKKLQKAVKELLLEFRRYTAHDIHIEFKEIDITNKQSINRLYKRGLLPTSLNIKDKKGRTIQTIIFPGLIFHNKKKEISVNFLKNTSTKNANQNINNSIELLEYELTNALRLLYQKKRKKIAFIKGHKFSKIELADITIRLSQYYILEEIDLLQKANLNQYTVLMLLQPKNKFLEDEKYKIDQYLMNGGKLFISIDEVAVDYRRLHLQNETLAMYKPNSLEDQLFTYGIRINPDLLLDLQAVLIPVKTSLPNEPIKFTPVPWYYEPLLTPNPSHPITKGLNLVKASYINSIDFVGNNDLRKTILLATSTHTMQKKVPCKVDLSITMKVPEKLPFNAGIKPVAGLLEGEFSSIFSNRRKYKSKKDFKVKSVNSKIIVVADDDMFRNKVKGVGNNLKFQELGYDTYTNQKFGNKDFIMNAIEYLCDDFGWTNLRSRDIKMRLLNKSKMYSQRLFWQAVNFTIPIFYVLLYFLLFQVKRRYQYSNFFKKKILPLNKYYKH